MKKHDPTNLSFSLALSVFLAAAHAANAATYLWTNTTTSSTWSAPASWSPNTSVAGPTTSDTAVFGNAAVVGSSSTINNTVDVNFTVAGLGYTNNFTTAQYQVTSIPAGVTLAVTGPVSVGGANASSADITYAYLTGAGTFQVTGSPLTIQNYGSASGANATAYLNLSGLATFIYNNSSGTISIEDNPGSLTRLGGNLVLAATSNNITVQNLNLGTSTSAQAGPAGTLTLGPGTNIINVATLNLANQKSTFTINNSGGGLRLRGVSGADTDRPPIILGNRSVTGGTGTTTGNLLLNGCSANIKASTITIGENGGATASTAGNGVLQFDTGTVDATTIVMATAPSTGNSTGTLTVGANGATLLIGTGGLSLVNQGAGTCSGTLNIAAGGTVNCSGNIGETTATGTGTVNVGGALIMGAGTFIGSSSLPVNNFTISNNATLQFTIPSGGQPNAVVGTLNWPANDNTLAINIEAPLPAGVTVGSAYTLFQANAIVGTVASPVVNFPGQSGVAGYVSQSGNSIVLNISAVGTPPFTPTNLTATAGNAQVALSWNASSGGTPPITYSLARSTASGQETVYVTGISATSYTDLNVTNGASYYYEVAAEDAHQLESTYSAEVSASPVGPPPAPWAVVGSLLGANVVLTWMDVDAATYNVLRATSISGPYTSIASGLTAATFTDSGVALGVPYYYYEIQGVNTYGTGPASSPATVPYGQGNQLANPGFEGEPGTTNWTLVNDAIGNVSVETTNDSLFYYNSATGECPQDPQAELVSDHSGTNVGKLYGSFNTYPNLSAFQQSLSAAPGSTWAAGGWCYASHEDLSGINNFYYEVDFFNLSGTLIASYESSIVKNLTCGETTPFPVDTWVFLAVTNQMQVTNGVNTGVVIGNTGPADTLIAPPNTASVRYEAAFNQPSSAGGSIYLDDCELALISGPVPPSVSAISPNNITLCTNTFLTCTVQSSRSTLAITNVQVIVNASVLGGFGPTTISTNGPGSPGLSLTGLGSHTVNVTYALPTNVILNITVIGTDANGLSAAANASLDTLAPVLVFEAADFNFSSGQFIDTPPNGGLALYTNQIGTAQVDENKGTRTAPQSYYRPSDAVIIQAANPVGFTEQKFVTAAANGDTTDIEVEVGYNSAGDWLNYTRSFGSEPTNSAPEGTYGVWLYSATSGTGTQSALYQVISPPNAQNQSTNFLGYFGTSAYSNNNYFNYQYLPLTDAYGNPVAVTFSNVTTLRSVVVGNPNLAFYMLTPIVTPSLLSVYPNGPFDFTNQFTFTITPNSGASIPRGNISIVLNGITLTSGFTLTQSGGNWIFSCPLVPNTVYSAVINVTNSAGLAISVPLNFDTFNINNYEWEAVDYDFSTNNGSGWISGLFIDNPVPTGDVNAALVGTYQTNSYFGYPTGFLPGNDPTGNGAVAQQGIDMNWADPQTGADEYYRLDGVGSQPAADYVRPKFIAEQQALGDPNIGPYNIGFFNASNWLNYTRTYPTNNFYVWGRLAGGGGPFSGTTLSLVTSGVGTSNQTTTLLGSFADSEPAGWQVYHWVPLLAANGSMAVVPLGGKATLRLTSGAELNAEYFMLVAAPPSFVVTATLVSGQVNLSFPTVSGYTYTLMHKSALSAPTWTPVGSPLNGDGTVHTLVQPAAASQGFYTVLAQPQL